MTASITLSIVLSLNPTIKRKHVFLRNFCLILLQLLCFTTSASDRNPSADSVTLIVDAQKSDGVIRPIWPLFGYDEPNYTYMKGGKKLLQEIAAIGGAQRDYPVYIRTHNLLTTGDGTGERKWGSTNAYTEDENGNPVYDWTIVDRILDTYIKAGLKPLVEIGFMPQALSINPEPYKHHWAKDGSLWTGWAYPPKDYEKWSALVYELVTHTVERYGHSEVESWLWEPWNEPDIGYWQGSKEEFFKLYDYSADAVKRACSACRVGGPHTTNPNAEKAAAFLRDFLEHCATGKNAVNQKRGSPLDYIAFHAKGNPTQVDGHIRMDMSPQLKAVKKGFEIVSRSKKFRQLPVLIGEFDPEGCAACSIQQHPHYAYRNGVMYPVYTAASQARLYELAEQYNINCIGALTWGFEFENERYFDGFRELATNGIDKPVLNVFRMFGKMPYGNKLPVQSSRGLSVERIINDGVRAQADIDGLAGRDEKSIAVIVWNYHDDDLAAPASRITLEIKNMPAEKLVFYHYRIDRQHSNAFEAWKAMGSPQNPTPEQYTTLERAGQLQLLTAPRLLTTESGRITLKFELPRHAVSMLKFDLVKPE